MTNPQAAHAIADPAAGLILAALDIAAPPERVFRALMAAEEVTQWWGAPDAYRTEAWAADLRAGGFWRGQGRGADGKSFTVSGAGTPTMFVCGNNPEAKTVVSDVLDQFGWETADLGTAEWTCIGKVESSR